MTKLKKKKKRHRPFLMQEKNYLLLVPTTLISNPIIKPKIIPAFIFFNINPNDSPMTANVMILIPLRIYC